MTLTEIIERYKNILVISGFLVGGLSILGVLPDELPVAGDNAMYVYIGVIALATYTFHKFYWNPNAGAVFERTVPARSLSDPRVRQDIARQRGTSHMQQPPQVEQPPAEQPPVPVSDDLRSKFEK